MTTEQLALQPITRNEAKELIKKVDRIGDEVPSGLSNLNEALTFAKLDLLAFISYGSKMTTFNKAVAFARSIPEFEDLKIEACADWMLHDLEHRTYLDI